MSNKEVKQKVVLQETHYYTYNGVDFKLVKTHKDVEMFDKFKKVDEAWVFIGLSDGKYPRHSSLLESEFELGVL